MPIKGERPLPHNSQEAWISLFNQPPLIPNLINNNIGIKENFLKHLAEQPGSASDTYVQALARTVEAHVIYISQEFELGEHINVKVKQAPRVFETVVEGVDLNREDVVRIMERGKYQDYEDTVANRVAQRDAKIASRR